MSYVTDWCFTCYDAAEISGLVAKADYCIYGEEVCPSTGKVHYQGYAEFPKKTRLTALKKIAKTTHFEPRKGSQQQAIDYCKKDGKVIGSGMPRAAGQGRRTDLEAVRTKLDEGISLSGISSAHFPLWCQYGNRFKEYRALHEPTRNWETEVIVLWGTTGTGKTREAKEAGAKTVGYTSGGFFIGYDGEDTILFDEFDPSCMSRELFLQITDRYSLTVNVKGGERNWKPRTIYFTSNHDPSGWYGMDGEPDPAVRRRFTKVVHKTCLLKPLNLCKSCGRACGGFCTAPMDIDGGFF